MYRRIGLAMAYVTVWCMLMQIFVQTNFKIIIQDPRGRKLNISSDIFGMKTLVKMQYIPRSMHTVFALLCFVVVIHWLIFPYPSGLLHWLYGNLTIAPVPAKQPWWIWITTSCEFIMNDCITTTKQSTTKPCAYFLGYTVWSGWWASFESKLQKAPFGWFLPVQI